MTAALLFAATFGVVFALGLQSLNVNGGHRALAFVTSFGIGASNLVLFKVLPGPTEPLEIAAYLVGGPIGILAAMAAHPLVVAWLARRRARPAGETSARVPTMPPRPAPSPRSACEAFARELLDPEGLGHMATPEIRNAARQALGLQSVEAAAARASAPR